MQHHERAAFETRRSPAVHPMATTSVVRGGAVTTRRFGKLVARSPAMHQVFDLLGRLAPTDVTVTLIGETGTGKDVLAHVLHEHSARSKGELVVFDCGAVPGNLAESELFGHERGAFTGALAAHAGAFERAHGGTLFLDEVGELPLDLQTRLLRVLDGRRVRRVGGTQDRTVDVRVVAATNRDLVAEVSAGRFRQDLFFRLAGAIVPVPSLRSRLEDLPLLVTGLLEDMGRGDVIVPEVTLAAVRAHTWPGNVRELKNALGCAVALLDGRVLEPRYLRLLVPADEASSTLEHLALGGRSLQIIERAAIKQTLNQTGGNKVLAARSLGIAVSTLYQKLKKHDLVREYRSEPPPKPPTCDPSADS